MEDVYKGKEEMEDALVEEAFQKLLDAYLNSKHRKKTQIIQKAFIFAKNAHKGARRLSGEPYIMHPIAVAQIVCSEIGLGSTSICAALLHDVVEDTDYTVEDIQEMFGEKIALIVDGLTKISGGIFGEEASAQAENFKKLLLTMNEDIRVVLIKIADRLHNMRTLGSQPKNKQYKIAGETQYIYAPLAYKLGLYRIKGDLENLSFKYEHPQEYKAIEDRIKQTEEERNRIFENFTGPIKDLLTRMGFTFEIKGRIKTPYSIWNKMMTKKVDFKDVYDILAVRIIFEPKDEKYVEQECFNIYVALTSLYKRHPERVRDWVTNPKSNGYQALHVTLMSNDGVWIEVQIRSRKMDEKAEKGVAAHWKYKGETDDPIEGYGTELDNWLGTIKEVLDDPQPDAIDFMSTIKLNMYASEILVFTPKGEMKTLPKNSTVLDFAFSIHSLLGSHCLAAKVNNKLVSRFHVLNGGDQVEIVTSSVMQVEKEWLKHVVTAKATNKINVALRKRDRERRKKGEKILQDFFEERELTYNTIAVERIFRAHGMKNAQQLYLALGEGSVELNNKDEDEVKKKKGKKKSGWKRLISFGKKNDEDDDQDDENEVVEETEKKKKQEEQKKAEKKKVIVINDDNINTKYLLADCCKPIPGDLVMGYLNEKKQIIVHTLTCSVAEQLKANRGNRLLSAEWEISGDMVFPANISIKGMDRIGLLNEVTQIISTQYNANMKKLVVECNEDMFTCTINLMVKNKSQVDEVIEKLKGVNGVNDVIRL